jgi:alcohol dehydrogenase (cytochrome c)
MANRNGFYYVLDRVTGEFIRGTAFDRQRQLFFVPVREMGSRYLKAEATYEPGKPFMGGGEIVHNPGEAYGAVRALDALTGERRWEHRLLSPLWAGLMATGGGLVFGSTNEGNVFALDADTRRPLWNFQTGSICYANPVSFLLDGRQHVAVACGQALFVFGLPDSGSG